MSSHTGQDKAPELTTVAADVVVVSSREDIEDMRLVRNQVRQYMTHNTDHIEHEQQMDWYDNVYLPAVERGEMQGFLVRVGNVSVGYGLVTRRDGQFWVSGGLVEDVRGQGFGKQLFRHLTDYVVDSMESPEVWLDVQKGNVNAFGLYRSLGYVATAVTSEVIVMRYRGRR